MARSEPRSGRRLGISFLHQSSNAPPCSSRGPMSEQRTAVVTGGGSGIGLAISERLAGDGLAVAVFDRDAESARSVASKIEATGATAMAVTVDVTDREQIDAGVAEVHDRLGPATVLVNNAGLQGFDPFLSISLETWR